MPFNAANSKPLSTLSSRNILAKENVPKGLVAPAGKKPGATTLAAKKGTTQLLKPGTGAALHEPTKPNTRLSHLPKLTNTTTKVSEKENTLIEHGLHPATAASRIPLKSIKKPASATTTSTTSASRTTTHTRVYPQPVHGLKTSTVSASKITALSHSVKKTASNFALDSLSSSTSGNVLPKDTLLPVATSSVSSVSSLSSITSSSSTTSSATLTAAPVSKVPKSIPKKRVKSDENLPTHSVSSPLGEDDKENQLYSSSSTASKYQSAHKNVGDDDGVDVDVEEYGSEMDTVSSSRSKKLRLMDSDFSNKALSKINYKPIHVHEEVIEEKDENESKDYQDENKENQRAELERVHAYDRTIDPIQPPHALQKSSVAAHERSAAAYAPATAPVTLQPKDSLSGTQATKVELMAPPSTLSLSDKMKKFGIPEIDVDDVEDVTSCAEYVQEILEYLMQREKTFMPNPDYIALHPELRWHMRVILVDWLMEVSQKFKFLPETLFLGVNIMDRFLSKRSVSLNKFQLVGLASLMIAAKIEEIYCPPVSNFTFMADSAFNDNDMILAEQYILKTLTFDMWAPGPFTFIRRISKVDEYNPHHRQAAKFIAEAALLTHDALHFPPSLLAASAMYLARCIHKVPGSTWGPAFQAISGYAETDLLSCVRVLLRFIAEPSDADSFFFKKKYAGKRYVAILNEIQTLATEAEQIHVYLPSSSAP